MADHQQQHQRRFISLKLAALAFLFPVCVSGTGKTGKRRNEADQLHEAVGTLDLPPDAEELDMVKTMLLQKGDWSAAADFSEPAKSQEDSAKNDSPYDHSYELNVDGKEKHIAAPPAEDTSLVVAVDDAPPASSKSPKKAISAAATGIIALPQTSMDGATQGMVNTRLASEEQFSSRLQALLSKSGEENRKEQEQVVTLQAQLQTVLLQKKRLRSKILQKVFADRSEITKQRSRADTAEERWKQSARILGMGTKQVTWLRQRVKTLLVHLSNVTHIGEVLEHQLTEANKKAASKGVSLAAIERRVEREPARLRAVEAGKSADEARMKAMERQNALLQERLESMNKRDQILHTENGLLRSKASSATAAAQQESTELESVKAALAETQKSNMQLQSKLAESLKALIVAQAGAEPAARTGASLASVSMDLSSLEQESPGAAPSDGAESQAAPSLASDSSSLTALLKEESAKPKYVAPVRKPSVHETRLLELTSESQGLNTLEKDSHLVQLFKAPVTHSDERKPGLFLSKQVLRGSA